MRAPWLRLLALAAGLTIVGLMGRAVAAPPARLIKIGALTESWGPTPAIIGLREGLLELGYRENEHFVIGVRFTQGNPAELAAAARELVRHGVDIIVTAEGGNTAKAAQAATSRIPIVFMGGSDPVGIGLVQSLAHPGGNITGTADLDIDLGPKRMEIFRELIPGLKRILLPYDATNAYAVAQLPTYRDAARRLGITLVERPLRTEEEARAALAKIRKGEVDGILSPRFLSLNIPGFILDAAQKQGLPTMFHGFSLVEHGGLAAYSAADSQLGRQAARLVDKILNGAKPADLPIEQPTTFELVINSKTAKALGLSIPPSVLLRANRVIE
ncbi:MAG: ABC transporter substrate-binding protein [Candidatus Rokuibacteriota bacterium]|nr:MAG: ABC transporter substrate-binding protein [Candidatus Rokubacteria bacterium]